MMGFASLILSNDFFLLFSGVCRFWVAIAKFAAAGLQERSLKLPRWQPPPADITYIEAALQDADQQRGYRAAALLLQRTLGLGISRWHPSPLDAIAEAGRA
jgi:hypothetical protein